MPFVPLVFGNSIYMNTRGEHPPRHFHIMDKNGNTINRYDFENFEFLDRDKQLNKSDKKAIKRWTIKHIDELEENWKLIMSGEKPKKISGEF